MQFHDNVAYPSAVQKDGIDAIDYPQDGDLRWRKIVRRSGTRPTGKYPSWKIGRMVQWESNHELNAFRLLDADPTVTAFYEQPVKITYTLNGISHYHIPDVLVITAAGKYLWEVKTSFDAAQPEISERTHFLSLHLPQHGYEYHIALAEDLAQMPRLDAVLQVLKYGRAEIAFIERERIRNIFLHALHPVTWDAVLKGVFGTRGRYHICRLMLEGFLEWNPNTPLTAATILNVRAESHQLSTVQEA